MNKIKKACDSGLFIKVEPSVLDSFTFLAQIYREKCLQEEIRSRTSPTIFHVNLNQQPGTCFDSSDVIAY